MNPNFEGLFRDRHEVMFHVEPMGHVAELELWTDEGRTRQVWCINVLHQRPDGRRLFVRTVYGSTHAECVSRYFQIADSDRGGVQFMVF